MPWVQITRIHPTHHPKSRDGSSTFQIETLGGRPQEEEEDHHHHAPQDHPWEAVEEEEVVEVEEVAEGEEEEEGVERSHYRGTHPLNRLKNF